MGSKLFEEALAKIPQSSKLRAKAALDQLDIAHEVSENSNLTGAIINAIRSKPFSALSANERIQGLSVIVEATILRLGQKRIDSDRLSAMIVICAKDLANHYPVYSMQDIEIACELICSKKLEIKQDVLFFSPSNLIYWLKCYVEQKRTKVYAALQKQKEEEEALKNKLTEDEQRVLFEHHRNKHLQAIKANGGEWVQWGDGDAMCLHYFERFRGQIANIRMWEELQEVAPKMLKRFEMDSKVRREKRREYAQLIEFWTLFEGQDIDVKQLNESLKNNALWVIIQNEAKKECVRALLLKVVEVLGEKTPA
ncbi:MAG: hypothetical protein ACFB0B_15510 [Thermonemataceae bacterium]